MLNPANLTATELAVMLNAASILVVIAISVTVQRRYPAMQFTSWIKAHVVEFVLVSSEVFREGWKLDAPVFSVAQAALFLLCVWQFYQVGLGLRDGVLASPRTGWTAFVVLMVLEVGLGLAGAPHTTILLAPLLLIMGVLAWLGLLFFRHPGLTSTQNAIWLGIPHLGRAFNGLLFSPLLGTPMAWVVFMLGAGAHLAVGIGMTLYLVNEAIDGLTERQRILEEAARLKSEFLNVVSHELLTPITVIKQASHSLAFADEAARREMQAMIGRQSDEMEHMVKAILEYAKLESKTYALDPVDEDLGMVLEPTVRQLMSVAGSSGHQLVLDMADDALLVRHDPELIRHLVRNLVMNAVKYTPVGTTITVRAHRVGDAVRLSVVDDGPGIAPEVKETIFERFQQGGSSMTRRQGGVGLGLAICREIVETYHEGRIWVESEPGEGAAFHVEFRALEEARVASAA